MILTINCFGVIMTIESQKDNIWHVWKMFVEARRSIRRLHNLEMRCAGYDAKERFEHEKIRPGEGD